MGIAILLFAKSTDIYFGRGAAVGAALFCATNVNVLALGHMAVYDVVSIAFLSLAFWGVAKLYQTENRMYAFVTGICLALTALSKYPFVIMTVPLIALVVLLRGKRALLDIPIILACLYVIIVYVYYAIVGYELIAGFTNTATMHTPSKDVVGVALLHLRMSALPLVFSLAGLVVVWKANRRLFIPALLLVATLAMWPSYHLFRMITVSQQKHIVLGFLFASPVVGVALYALWKSARYIALVVLVALSVFAFHDLPGLDLNWNDMRQTTQQIEAHIQPDAYVYTVFGEREMVPSLLKGGYIKTPWVVHSRFTKDSRPLCSYALIVADKPTPTVSGHVVSQKELTRCGFVPVYQERQTRYGLSGKGIGSWQSTIILYTKDK